MFSGCETGGGDLLFYRLCVTLVCIGSHPTPCLQLLCKVNTMELFICLLRREIYQLLVSPLMQSHNLLKRLHQVAGNKFQVSLLPSVVTFYPLFQALVSLVPRWLPPAAGHQAVTAPRASCHCCTAARDEPSLFFAFSSHLLILGNFLGVYIRLKQRLLFSASSSGNWKRFMRCRSLLKESYETSV